MDPVSRFLEAARRLRREILYRRKIAGIHRRLRGQEPFLHDAARRRAHRLRWAALGRFNSARWYDVYRRCSGIDSLDFVPENVYYLAIEPRLNRREFSTAYKDKNFYDLYYRSPLFPVVYLRDLDGVLYDRDYAPATVADDGWPAACEGAPALIVKPSVHSSGGKNVRLFTRDGGRYRGADGEILTLGFLRAAYGANFVVQERIRAHEYFRRFNDSSLNTVRIVTYRSPRTGAAVVLQTVLRIGAAGSVVDNQAAGGIACGVDETGCPGRFAVDKRGRIHEDFLPAGFDPRRSPLPRLPEMKAHACALAARNYYARLLGFDFCLDDRERVRLLEINNLHLEINFLQMTNGPLFGPYTDEIIAHCARPGRRRG